jgi:hypothetical protein
MNGHHQAEGQSERVEVEVLGAILVCEQTPTGSWICCAEEGVISCARGFTPASAAALWEKAQIFED